MHTFTKRTVRVTLDIECYEDLDLDNLNWEEFLGLEDNEKVYCSVKDYADIF